MQTDQDENSQIKIINSPHKNNCCFLLFKYVINILTVQAAGLFLAIYGSIDLNGLLSSMLEVSNK